MRPSVVGPRGGGLYVSEAQRTRLLDATFALVAEQGYAGLTVRKVCERAGISSKTFYDLFIDREDCFLAAFDHAIEELAAVASPAYVAEDEWTGGVRAALGVLLERLDGEPALRRLVFVEALAAGPRVLARRAEILEQLTVVVDRGRDGVKAAAGLPPLTAEGVVGATFGLLYARLLHDEPDSRVDLLAGLMATIVLPYRGRAAAARELSRPVPQSAIRAAREANGPSARALGSGPPVDFRLTVRTQAVLAAVAGNPGVNNREVSGLVHVADQGQISRLMARLQEQRLVENRGGHGQGAPKAWSLTTSGEEIVRANPPLQGTRTAGRASDPGRALR